MEHLEQIKQLLFSCQKENIELAKQLAKSQHIDLEKFLFRDPLFSKARLWGTNFFLRLPDLQVYGLDGLNVDFIKEMGLERDLDDRADDRLEDISFLEEILPHFAPFVETFSCRFNKIKDISVLKYLPNLTGLMVSKNQISDLSVVAYFPKLEILEAEHNTITSLAPLNELALEHLEVFRCKNNPIPKEDIKLFKKLHPNCKVIAK